MSWLTNGMYCDELQAVVIVMTEAEAKLCRRNCAITSSIQKELIAMPREMHYQHVEGRIIRESEKAIRFKVDHAGHVLDGESFWFPRSQVKSIDWGDSLDPAYAVIEVADWLVNEKVNELAARGD